MNKFHSVGLGVIDFALRPRRLAPLIIISISIGVTYNLATFSLEFMEGYGPFWAYPVGPWLQDAADAQNNLDILDYLVAYTGFVHTPWSLAPFYVPQIGAPLGTSVVFLDVIPIAALVGRAISEISGIIFLPYGAWIALCFILAPVFATLMLFEGGQRSYLAAAAASIFAISAPTLLHRFGHLPLMAHFLVIGALYLYLREQRALKPVARLILWLVWLLLGLLTNAYMFAMVSAVYSASVLRSWRVQGVKNRLIEPALTGCVLVLMLFMLGFIGTGASLSAQGYGDYSMNLLSPMIPQRSGLFKSMNAIIDATGGQYEGFNYFGVGGLLIIALALVIDSAARNRALVAHRELAFVLLCLSVYAVSNQVWIGSNKLFEVDLGWRLSRLVGIYRSSGRMFWPTYYALILGSLILVLNRINRRWAVPLIVVCCLLQLIDSEPLRARMTSLTRQGGTPLLDQQIWRDRIKSADFVEIFPTFFCSDDQQRHADMELQVLAIRSGKSFNVAYNPRLHPDCAIEAGLAVRGPWKPATLYVFLNGPVEVPRSWTPVGLACDSFSEGKWCFGRANEAEPIKP